MHPSEIPGANQCACGGFCWSAGLGGSVFVPPEPSGAGKPAQARESFSPETNTQSIPSWARTGIMRIENAISGGKRPREGGGEAPQASAYTWRYRRSCIRNVDSATSGARAWWKGNWTMSQRGFAAPTVVQPRASRRLWYQVGP